jgi:hypothetical protein
MTTSRSERCPLCHRRLPRTTRANALLWQLYTRMSEKLRPGGQQFSAEAYHVYMKVKYLGADEHLLPNGKTVQIPHSTAGLDVEEFADFLAKVEAEANERGVYLDDKPQGGVTR